jgi:beta-lactamase regulating signal transducer with metallopeptidase domain
MVISQGVVDALDGPELDLVCAHEAAHLRLRHRHFLVFALMVQRIFWFWPPTQISTSTLRLALERWADEVAAGDSQELRKRLQVALLAVAGMANEPAMAAFSAADGLMDRITCLDSVPRRRHPGWWIVALAPALAFGIATVVLGTQIVHEILCLVAI